MVSPYELCGEGVSEQALGNLGLSDGLNGSGGVQLYSRDAASFVRSREKSGRTQMLKP